MNEPELCEGADFCQELAGALETSFSRTYEGDPESRTILENDQFALLADMSPLTVGHLLLMPKRHYLSFAQVARDSFDETREILDHTLSLYASRFRQPLVLEHGSAVDEDQKACITHAHLHILPLNGHEADELFSASGVRYVDIAGLHHLAQNDWPGRSYYLRIYRGRYRVYFPERAHRRQYLRSIAGQLLSISDPEWDYAVVVRKRLLRETMRMTADWRLRPARKLELR